MVDTEIIHEWGAYRLIKYGNGMFAVDYAGESVGMTILATTDLAQAVDRFIKEVLTNATIHET